MRTKTYIAGDWDNDKEAIDKIYEWKKDKFLNLDFTDAHELTQSKDTSLSCSIKKSLKERLDVSKTFVLIVGDHTKKLTKGGCQFCESYNSWNSYCARGYSIDYKSFIEYECDKAVNAGMMIVVLYNSTTVDKNKCPYLLINKGIHLPMKRIENGGRVYWNYTQIENVLKD